MRKRQTFRTLVGFVVTICFSLVGERSLVLHAQEEPERTFPLDATTLQRGQYVGAAACASGTCHGSVEPRDIYGVKQNEYFIWLKQDRHTQAYNVLLTEKSARIARNLKLKQKAHESAVCLDCHALNAPASAQAQPLDLAEGISCEACHGPAGGWLARHTEEGWTHEKSVEAGMRDLRSLTNRAEQCLTCHLGDSQKTVNHELIAAGHPDLIFELDNYSAVMPAHWAPYTTKRDPAGREEVGARAWALGQAVAFREGMQQVARRTRSDNWPEFAEMNCYACHHSLKDSEWRQIRGYRLKPGLPPWNPARYAVLRQIVATFAPQERGQLDTQVDRLAVSIAQMNTPPATVAATATSLANTIDRVIPRIRQAEIDSAAAGKLIDAIARDVPYLVDSEVHSVEQAIMAINALANTMARTNPSLAQGGVSRTIDKLYDDVKDRENFDRTQFAQHVAELQRQLR
jgi:nitrate/TMAO reductase-like tetraheme cytochrome c subunit